MGCTVIEKIKCKECGENHPRSGFYFLADTYTLQPCKECRKKYGKNRYDKGIGFYSDKKNNLKNKIKNDEK